MKQRITDETSNGKLKAKLGGKPKKQLKIWDKAEGEDHLV